MRRRRAVFGAAVVAAVVVAVGAVVVGGDVLGGDEEVTDLQRAISLAPTDAQRFSWTDWAGVRIDLDLELSSTSGPGAVKRLLDGGFDADLTSTSALVQSAVVLQQRFGFSPATVDWELFTQGDAGAAIMLALGADAAPDRIADSLRALGYEEPDAADGIWTGGAELTGSLGQVTPELTYISVDAGEGLVFTSDTRTGLQAALDDANDDGSAPDLDAVVDGVGEPLSAALYTGDQACFALAMAGADPTERKVGDELLAQAGDVSPMTGFAMGAEPDGNVRVVMSFESESQARTNADTRAALASGPAPGQGGDFADRFTLGKVSAEANVVRMELEPAEGAYVLSDLSNGPVLFATC